MEADWDLHAVVRGCAAAATTTTTSPLCSFNPMQQDEDLLCSQDLFALNSATNESTAWFNEELHDLCLPFLPQSSPPPKQPPPTQSLPISVPGVLQDPPPNQPLNPPQLNIPATRIQPNNQSPPSNASTTSNSHTRAPTSKRRKNQMKRLCQVSAEDLSSDVWSWRKYGQKPIKGSPHPRGYYRCSTSKGCLARKQVERNRSDPSMFIVTYTGEHNHPMPTHRNSLAGSTRQKAATPQATTSGSETKKPTSLPLVSFPACLSPLQEKQESSREEKDDGFEDKDDEFGVSSVSMDGKAPEDDFFEGLADQTTPEIPLPTTFAPPCSSIGVQAMPQPPPPAMVDLLESRIHERLE